MNDNRSKPRTEKTFAYVNEVVRKEFDGVGKVKEENPVESTLTREQVETDIAYLQWLISRDEDFVEERHQRLEVLYEMQKKMDELENE